LTASQQNKIVVMTNFLTHVQLHNNLTICCSGS